MHPDKDILSNKPTIQIHKQESNIYNHNGKYVATIITERLHWLWNQFTHNNHSHITNFLQPPPQDFETEILWLMQRYVTLLLKKKPKTIQPKNQHHMLHQETQVYERRAESGEGRAEIFGINFDRKWVYYCGFRGY